jgi:flavin reductase (DIM6/NTAB) family NADH-FMN oxidoreductase RutF
MYITLKASEVEPRQLYSFMTSAVMPRPVAFVATVDKNGVRNLSPFSYFNCVSTKPPLLMIAPVKKMKDGTQKDTFNNLKEVPDLTINMVTFAMAEQMSLASSPYSSEVDEFRKSGFTPLKSELVLADRVAESPVSFECKVSQIIELGQEGGAGNLVLCEILAVHIDESITDEKGMVDPFKADFISRLGGNYYSRLIPESIFDIRKPEREIGIGFDAIPEPIRGSAILTGAELARLAGVTALPVDDAWEDFPELWNELGNKEVKSRDYFLHRAKLLLQEHRITEAWLVALQYLRK